MSYPPQEGFPAPMTPPPTPVWSPEPTVTLPTGQYPAQSPAAPGYAPPHAEAPGPSYRPPGPSYRPPRDRGRTTVLVLSIVVALLVVFGGLFFGLYLNEHGNLNDTKGNLRDTRADLTTQVTQQRNLVASQQEKLAAAEKQATDLNAQLDKLKTSSADVTAQRDALAPCMRHVEEMFDAVSTGDNSGFDKAYRATKAACDKAERKMDS